MLSRIADAGLNVVPRILVMTRLIPEARGTTCDERCAAPRRPLILPGACQCAL